MLYSQIDDEIKKFLELYYSKNFDININFSYKINYDNPIDMIEIISCLVDNQDKFNITVWVSLDKDIYILLNDDNINEFIKYLYERYPY